MLCNTNTGGGANTTDRVVALGITRCRRGPPRGGGCPPMAIMTRFGKGAMGLTKWEQSIPQKPLCGTAWFSARGRERVIPTFKRDS